MKIISFTGVTENENIRVFKPCGTILVKQVFPDGAGQGGLVTNAKIRISIINSKTGSIEEVCPEMALRTLSEICSQSEGFQIWAYQYDATHRVGSDNFGIILNRDNSVELDNDRYLDIKMTELSAACTYEIYTVEKGGIDAYSARYKRFFMANGELQKTITIDNADAIALPLQGVTEIKLYPITGSNVAIYTMEELTYLSRIQNDITIVEQRGFGDINPTISYGVKNMVVVPVTQYKSVDILQSVGQAVEVIIIDNVK